ncbi:hypothetical protein OEV98_12580 [Caldibacillus lycopersici]|uniref:GtrA-like protein domain-containing protein n=1 Tax=Perspicuibacillus lycopersici TaxID=1325689 RepID=A0AAE3IUE3_9BACI|nr:hypothetical protein [Perspicuibacillus lycopersici]MCU9614372.1 hypothetical protein [Perspicuibacillus lycopersici]
MSNLNIKNNKIVTGTVGYWKNYKEKHPNIAQFLVFFMLSNGITLLQLILMPVFKSIFANTSLVTTSFQVLQFGHNFDGTPYYIFDYAAGSLASGGGGGLAYFLAVQITIGIAQVINFFAQRNITFKSNSNVWTAAFWYVVAYIIITIGAAAAQGFYKAPIYNLMMNTWGMGSVGETTADVFTMIINSAISFWVFFPIFKIIFKQEPEKKA